MQKYVFVERYRYPWETCMDLDRLKSAIKRVLERGAWEVTREDAELHSILTVIRLKGYEIVVVGRDISVGIATLYGLDGPGIVFRWGRDFPHPSRPALGRT